MRDDRRSRRRGGPAPRGLSLLESMIALAILAAATLALMVALEAGRAREREAERRLDALDVAESLLQEALRSGPERSLALDGTRRPVARHPGLEASLGVERGELALPGFAAAAPGVFARVTVHEGAREILRIERFRVVTGGDLP